MNLLKTASTALLLVLTATLSGCANNKEDIFPNDMRPMGEVYDQHFSRLRQDTAPRQPLILPAEQAPNPPTPADHAQREAAVSDESKRYARDAQNEIDTLFPTLPNPHLVMYVYPHLSEDGAPVPGYATSFPMYEKTEYALPGEAR